MRKNQAIEEINQKLIEIINLLDILIKRASQNSENMQPWLTSSNTEKATELRNQNPALYDYIIQILKLYFT